MTDEVDKDEARERQSQRLQSIAREAEQLAAHARSTATHFRDREIARAGAHALALEGHLVMIRRLLDEIAISHAEKSRPAP